MNKKLRRLLHKILTSALVYIAALALPLPPAGKIALFVVAYFIVGSDILKKSFRNIRNGQIFDENFLMSIATAGAFALREYAEAVAVMLFFQIGEFFQSYAVNQSRKSIADLMDIRPDSANLLKDGKIETVSPEKVSVGDTILVRPGERIPLDGTVSRGSSGIDASALTGETMPREVEAGDTVISGCINLNGLLEIKVTSRYGDSTVAKILDLVENAGTKKADIENFITRFARCRHYRRPIGCFAASVSRRRVSHLGLSGNYLLGYLLPLRTGYFNSAQLLRRHRRRLQMRYPDQRQLLPGSPGRCRLYCI